MCKIKVLRVHTEEWLPGRHDIVSVKWYIFDWFSVAKTGVLQHVLHNTSGGSFLHGNQRYGQFHLVHATHSRVLAVIDTSFNLGEEEEEGKERGREEGKMRKKVQLTVQGTGTPTRDERANIPGSNV